MHMGGTGTGIGIPMRLACFGLMQPGTGVDVHTVGGDRCPASTVETEQSSRDTTTATHHFTTVDISPSPKDFASYYVPVNVRRACTTTWTTFSNSLKLEEGQPSSVMSRCLILRIKYVGYRRNEKKEKPYIVII
jgi:hypothetical protein